ncbi:neurofilament medium polypeptide-like [Trichomycterus rosablanca]|uniref:neurofilament medium polypeptide-like n=1 Tax=Trichomycterus rosablanca TaxID=2290929 RepID=UPI002F35B265
MLPLNLRASSRSRSPVRFNPNFAGGRVTGTSSGTGSWAMVNFPGEEKETMRCLNERLKDYLNQVKLLEEANTTLETQIKQVLTQKRSVGDRDWSGYHKTISILRQQAQAMTMENAQIMLQIDNARLAAEDFKVKLESESAIRQVVELDIASLRKVIDDTHLSRMHLESQIESLREELIYLSKAHEEDVAELKAQIQNSSVNVQMEANMGVDLTETIDTIRQQYERAVQKNREDTEDWYKAKFDSISAEVSRSSDELEQGKTELNEMHRQKQGMEIDLQTLHSMTLSLEDTLQETAGRYALDMNSYNVVLQRLEAELGDVHVHVARQRAEYQALLNIKCKLEEEIATYRRLLEGIGMANFDITDAGFRQNEDLKGFGAQDPPGLPSNAEAMDDNSLAGVDESVEFSLDQALYAKPPCPTSDSSLMNEMVEEEMNATNSAMNLQHNHEVTGSHEKECPVIMGVVPPEMIPLVCPLFKEYRAKVHEDVNSIVEDSGIAKDEVMGSNGVDKEEVQSIVVGEVLGQERFGMEVQQEGNTIVECREVAEELNMESKEVEEAEKSIVVCAGLKQETFVMEVQQEEDTPVECKGAAEELIIESETVGEEEAKSVVVCAALKQEITPPMICLEFQQEINTFVEFKGACEEEMKSIVECEEGAEREGDGTVDGMELKQEITPPVEYKGAAEEQINNIGVSIKIQEEVHIQEEAGAHGTKDGKLTEVNGGAVEEVVKTKGMGEAEEICVVEGKAAGQEEIQSIAEWMGADFKNEEEQNQ